jgi:hypothetical protein
MVGTWTLTAPDGRTWQADSPLRCTRLEQRERVPADVAFARILKMAAPVTDARRDEVMRHDFPVLQQFHTKYALGPLAAPSCLCCGKSTQGIEIGVQHMELPGVVICKPCKDAASQEDVLDMTYINSLPQPFIGRELGGWEWPINDFEVGTGLLRIDVSGLLQVKSIADFTSFKDGYGNVHSAEGFYVDATPEDRIAVIATPPQASVPAASAKPLTDYEIISIACTCNAFPNMIPDSKLIEFARAVLAARSEK